MKRKGRICEVCSATYNASYAAQRTCSRECGSVISSRVKPLVFEWRCILQHSICAGCGVESVSRFKREVCSPRCRRIARGMTPRGSLVTTQCGGCGVDFTYPLMGARRSLCDDCVSARARMAKYRAPSRRGGGFNARGRRKCRVTGAQYEPINRMAVLDRDGWNCGICGDAIDPGLHHSDLMAATVDHIVALAHGGDHTYANVQAAHALCNAYKSATDLDFRVAS